MSEEGTRRTCNLCSHGFRIGKDNGPSAPNPKRFCSKWCKWRSADLRKKFSAAQSERPGWAPGQVIEHLSPSGRDRAYLSRWLHGEDV